MSENVKRYSITQCHLDSRKKVQDSVVVEEPLEIRLVAGPPSKRRSRGLSITMRTPGNDFELSFGFLVSEGIVNDPRQIQCIEYCGRIAPGESNSNIVSVELSSELEFDFSKLQRHFYTTSSCGVCGKASLEALEAQDFCPLESNCRISSKVIHGLPQKLRAEQALFTQTGGIHAAGLFDLNGQMVCVFEDVGRHNAVDKLVGYQFKNQRLPLNDKVIVVSGRASFELMQKTLAAGASALVAVGAPSSLAVELAQKFNIVLIGFTSRSKFNIYSGEERVD